jgi:iron complex transport system permease protein
MAGDQCADVVWRGRRGSRDLALEPAFTTGAALGVALVAIGLGISFFTAEQWGLLGTATTIIGSLLPSGGVIGLVEADFAGLAFSALLFLALAVAIRSNFLIALVPLALAGALGSSTGYQHAVYMLTVNEPSITIAFFGLLAGAAYLVSQYVGQAYQGLAIIFARVSLILVNFGFWIGSLWGDYPARPGCRVKIIGYGLTGRLGASPTSIYRRSRSSSVGQSSS